MARHHVRDVARRLRRVRLQHQLREHLFERPVRHQGTQLIDRVFCDDAAAVQDDDAGAELLDDFEHMRAVEDGLAAAGEQMDEMPEHQRRGDVEAGVRFVEDQDVGIVQQRADDQHFLLHPFRVRADRLLGGIREAEQLEQRTHPVLEHVLGDLPEPADQLQLFATRQERIECRLLRHVAEPPPVGDRVVGDAAPFEQHRAARGLHQPGQHPAGRGLSRSVRSEVADHFPRAHDEAHVVDDLDAVETLDEVSRFEEGSGHDRTPFSEGTIASPRRSGHRGSSAVA
jgi:hypothetical protein